MIELKTGKEIERMRLGGRILAKVLLEVLSHVKPGVSELELNKLTEELILKNGAEPGFKKVKGYHHAICVSTNDVVVHGVPTNYRFKEGDVVGLDCGVYYKGFYTDMAYTLRVQTQNSKFTLRQAQAFGSEVFDSETQTRGAQARRGDGERSRTIKSQKDKIDVFLETGERALEEAIRVARIGNRIGHISKRIQEVIEGAGYSVVRSLVGHGVGRRLHEEPEVPGFLNLKIEETPLLKEGLTIAIEVIYNLGKSEVVHGEDDNWTIKTRDGSASSTFEKTIAITKEGPLILTG